MKTISGKIFQGKVSYSKLAETGLVEKVKEEYAVVASTFAECERKLTDNIGADSSCEGDFDVIAEAIAPYCEAYIFDDGDYYYKVKVTETIYNESTGNEREVGRYYLVNASTLDEARKNIITAFGTTIKDYKIVAVIEQNILNIIEL